MSKLDSLLWEQIIFDNFIISGSTEISQENLDDVLFDCIDELSVSRDDDYNIKLTCIRHINQFSAPVPMKKLTKKDNLSGDWIPEGKINIKLFGDFQIVMNPCYYNGYESKIDKTQYKLSCYHLEGKSLSKKTVAIKEWLINGNSKGLCFCVNKKFKYTIEETTFGSCGDIEFPSKQLIKGQEYFGNIVHAKYKDTAFDIHYVGDTYGPKWSVNISISYYENYGRIPNDEERDIIREYISFIAGKRLIYTGESRYDENGNVIGFVMEFPYSYGMEIKRMCANVGLSPIRDDYRAKESYFETFTNYIEPFEKLYKKLDFRSLFLSFWYAHEIAKPLDLPILSAALERLMKKWYSEIESNPETVLMNKKDFAKRIEPIKKMVEQQFIATEYAERMKRSILNINRMSVNEQFTNFFIGINLTVGEEEKKALRARNFSAHGSFTDGDENYREQFLLSRVYECLIARVVLKLLNYKGNYVDYRTNGYPEKNINCPIGCDELYRFPISMEYMQYYEVFCEVFNLVEIQEKREVIKDGLTIEIYNKENCHDTPHIHAYYHGKSIDISLVDGKIVAGNIPQKNKKIAQEWVLENLEMLRSRWKNAYVFIIFPDMNVEKFGD